MQGEEELSSRITPHTGEPDLPATPAGFPPGTVLDPSAIPAPQGTPQALPLPIYPTFYNPFPFSAGPKDRS